MSIDFKFKLVYEEDLLRSESKTHFILEGVMGRKSWLKLVST